MTGLIGKMVVKWVSMSYLTNRCTCPRQGRALLAAAPVYMYKVYMYTVSNMSNFAEVQCINIQVWKIKWPCEDRTRGLRATHQRLNQLDNAMNDDTIIWTYNLYIFQKAKLVNFQYFDKMKASGVPNCRHEIFKYFHKQFSISSALAHRATDFFAKHK